MRGWLLGAACAALTFASPAHAKWREASSDHFVIYSEASESSLREFATQLEKFDAALRQRFGNVATTPGKANRVTVFTLDSAQAVRRLAKVKGNFLAGYYKARATGPVAFVPRSLGGGGKNDLTALGLLQHEYVHHFMFQNLGGVYPSWFIEGFAEVYSTARYERDGSVGLGLPAAHRAYSLSVGPRLPMAKLLMAKNAELKEAERGAFYARSWLLTHYLTFEPARQGQLVAYLRAIGDGKSAEQANAVFGDLAVLDKELDAYVRRPRLRYSKIDAKDLKVGSIRIRDLGAGEEQIMDARIISRNGVNRTEALALLPEMRAAAGRFSGDAAVQAALAEAEYDAGHFTEAEVAADRALKADANHADALIYKARARIAAAEAAPGDAAWKEARQAIAAANRADPDDPEPLILFFQSYRRQGVKPTKNAVEGLEHAYSLARFDRGLTMNLATQYLIDGRFAEARKLLAPIAFDPHNPGLAKIAGAVVAQLDANNNAEALRLMRGGSRADQSGQ